MRATAKVRPKMKASLVFLRTSLTCAFVAAPAFQDAAQAAVPALLSRDPRPDLPRRVVTHVLRVPALQLRDPVPLLVLIVPHDSTIHRLARPYKDPTDRFGPAAVMKAASKFLLTNFTHSVIK